MNANARRRLLTSALLAWPAIAVWAAPPEGKGKDKQDKGPSHGGQGKPDKRGKPSQGVDKHGGASPKAGAAAVGGVMVTAGISVSAARSLAIEVGIQQGSHQALPPGIRKNLARGKPLPPGIAKKMAPPALVARLPVHPGYEWRVVGTDLVLVAIATLIIADVLFDVF